MPLKKLFRILLGVQVILGIGLVVHIIILFQNQVRLSQSRDIHFNSYLLADELRQSSDDLTRMARTYVAMGDEKYEREYWEVLAIRNGQKPRPQNYNRIYWDFVSGAAEKPRPDAEAVPLRELMVREGFTPKEFAKLAESQKYSDELVKTEMVAMNAIKGLFDDGTGHFTVKKKPDREMAIRLMNDEAYHQHKVDIMRPIDEFYLMFAERTSGDVRLKERRSVNLLKSTGVLIFVIFGMFGYSFIVIQRQISARERAEENYRVSEQKMRTIIEIMPVGVSVIDKKGNISFMNPALKSIFRLSEMELLGGRHRQRIYLKPDYSRLPPEEFASSRAIDEQKAVLNCEMGVPIEDGSLVWTSVSSVPVDYGDWAAINIVADISEKKKSTDLIEKTLREKEVLLREIHHRAKNNLQIVSSLIGMAAQRGGNAESRAVFKQAQVRIGAISLAHQKLYSSADLSKIDFLSYIDGLASLLFETYRIDAQQIQLKKDFEPVDLDISISIPLGLIIGELISNSLKYAFPQGRTGVLEIGLRKGDGDDVILRIADNGIGIPETVCLERPVTFGIEIVRALSSQLGAKIELNRTSGTAFTITFRKNKSAEET